MKMRVLAAGLTGVLILGGTMTIVQRAITQKTRGVLPEANDPAHAETRRATPILALPAPNHSPVVGPVTPPVPTPSAVEVAIATAPPEPALNLPPNEQRPAEIPAPVIHPTVAVGEPTPPVAEVAQAPTAVDPGPAGSQPADPAVTAARATPVANPGPRDVLSDPVQSVESFVEQNRREADQAIQTLANEAEALKGRLAKVEVALARWQTFSKALNTDLPPTPTASPAPSAAPAESPVGQPDPGPAPATASEPVPIPGSAPPVAESTASPIAEPTAAPVAIPSPDQAPAPTPAPVPASAPGEPLPPPSELPAPGDATRPGEPQPAAPPLDPAPEAPKLPKTRAPR